MTAYHDVRKYSRILLCGLLAGLALACDSVMAQAAPSFVGGASGGTVSMGALNDVGASWGRQWAANATTGETLISDPVSVRIGAANADMFAVRSVGMADALAVGSRLIPVLGTAALLYTLYHGMRCQQTSGSWSCDPGVPATQSVVGSYSAPSILPQMTPEDAATAWAYASGASVVYGVSCPAGGIPLNSSGTCAVDRLFNLTRGTQYISVNHGNYSAYNCAGAQPGPDRMCPSGVSNPVTEAQAASVVKPYAHPAMMPDVLKQAVQNAQDLAPVAKPQNATGPATVTQPATTTTVTSPNGTQAVTTVNVTNNIAYNGDTYNVTSSSTTTTNPDGSTQTTTQTPQPTDCQINPAMAGCVVLGDPGTGTLPTDTRSVSFSPVDFGSSAGCPAPATFSAFGHSYSLTFDTICSTVTTWVRPLVLLAGAFIASFVFIQGLKS